MRQVATQLWIGNALDARNIPQLYEAEIRAVVDLAMEEKPIEGFPRDLACLRIPIIDGAGNDPSRLAFAVRATSFLLNSNEPTLVACSGGMSRAPSVAAAAQALNAKQQNASEWLQKIVEGHPHDVLPQLWQDVIASVGLEDVGLADKER